MKSLAAAVPVKGWIMLAAIVGVIGVGTTTVYWPHALGTHVLGEKTVAPPSAGNNMVGNGNGNGNGLTFTAVGIAPTNVRPGASAPVDVEITNNSNFAISVTQITVVTSFALTPAVAGCPVSGNFTTSDYSGPAITVAKGGGTVQLSTSSVPSTQWPQVNMSDTGNQDACQGAKFSLSIQATAVKA